MNNFRRNLLINQKEKDYSDQYFTIKALSSGTISLYPPPSSYNDLAYSKNGKRWVYINPDSTYSIQVSLGDKIRIKCVTTAYMTLIKDSSCQYEVFGNIMSLLYGDDFKDKLIIQTAYTFSNLFYGSHNLLNAKNLILPATILTECCYYRMFCNCSNLTVAPELPATTLARSCYYEMFCGCTSLTAAPVLPATTLVDSCYNSMFRRCTSLTETPQLPVTTLAYYCYNQMFQGCTKLNKITMLATDISASGCLIKWVNGVAPSGTFIKHPDMSSLPIGESGIPSGWTVVNNF